MKRRAFLLILLAIIGGLLCGVFLAVSVNLQQFGITYYPDGVASEARAGFLTALYVIIVPLITVFLGKKLGLPIVLSVFIAMTVLPILILSILAKSFRLHIMERVTCLHLRHWGL